MIGLRSWERDALLPERLGDGGLRILAPEEILRITREHLAKPGAPEPCAAELRYARWKPGIALTASWELFLADGSTALVTAKQHRGAKTHLAAAARASNKHAERAETRLLPIAVLPAQQMTVWTFPTDRVLNGSARAADSRRMARVVEAAGMLGGAYVRRSRSRSILLRYKPERRALFRFEAVARQADDSETTHAFLLRALDPDTTPPMLAHRRAVELQEEDLLPRLLWTDVEHGLVLEEWLPGRAPDPDDYSRGRLSGNVVARLHQRPLPPAGTRARANRAEVEELLRRDARLVRLLERCPPSSERAQECWVHGDFHPDQMLVDGEHERARLVDLDALRPGEAAEDLASWIADRLASFPQMSVEEAGADLLHGYAEMGTRSLRRARIDELVAEELVLRAAAALRRLERGAIEKAAICLERAREVAEPGGGLS